MRSHYCGLVDETLTDVVVTGTKATGARLERMIKEFNLYPDTVKSQGIITAIDEMRDKYVGEMPTFWANSRSPSFCSVLMRRMRSPNRSFTLPRSAPPGAAGRDVLLPKY